MDVIVDGYIYYAQKIGGISRIFNEVLPLLPSIDPAVSVKILLHERKRDLDGQIEQIIIPNPEKHIPSRRMWRHLHPFLNDLLINRRIKQTRDKVFHSTYYRSLKNWDGRQVCSVYDLIYEKYPNLFADADEIIFRKSQAFKRADHFICISNTSKEELSCYYNIPEEKMSVAHLAYSEQYQPVAFDQISFHVNTPFILYVGGRSKYKGFADLISAYSRWVSRYDVNLIVVGAEWSKTELELLDKAGIKDRVLLLRNINDLQLRDLYNQAMAFIYPSHYEGFGIPLLEAMACRCPVIASDVPSTREVAGDIPFYFEAANSESLGVALDVCIEKKSRKSDRVNMGLNWVKRYSWEKTAQAFVRVYRNLELV